MAEKKYHNKIEPNAQGKKEAIAAKQIHFKLIDSTNNWAKAHPDQWAAQGVTLVTASEQTTGRGRFKRKWVSPPDVNIYATFCLWFDPKRMDVGYIPQLLALAASAVLEQEGFSPRIKWPNDVLIEGKKVAGILCETIFDEDRRGVVCGIGLNVNMGNKELHQIDRPATSLLMEGGGRTWDVGILLHSLAENFIESLEKFLCSGFAPFFPLLQERSFLKKGDAVHFLDHHAMIEAEFEALHPNGSVGIKLRDGTVKIFHAGEFT